MWIFKTQTPSCGPGVLRGVREGEGGGVGACLSASPQLEPSRGRFAPLRNKVK